MADPIVIYAVFVTIVSIIAFYYLLGGVVTDEKNEDILIQSYNKYGKTQRIELLPFYKINIIKRTRTISKFYGTPEEEDTYIIVVKPMPHTNYEFKIE